MPKAIKPKKPKLSRHAAGMAAAKRSASARKAGLAAAVKKPARKVSKKR